MKISTTIAILATSFALTACTSNIASDADALQPAMKDAKMMDGKDAMKDAKMMDGKDAMKDGKMMDSKHAMKDGKMMDGKHAMKKDKMKDTTMMKGDSCHNHSANSMTKSSSHCHKSSQANHSHKYGG